MATHTAGTQFRLGGGREASARPSRLATWPSVPGNHNAVAVAHIQPGLSPPGTGVAVYDNGVQGAGQTSQSFGSGPSFVAFGATASTLYGSVLFSGGLQKISGGRVGVTSTGATSFSFVGELQFETVSSFTTTAGRSTTQRPTQSRAPSRTPASAPLWWTRPWARLLIVNGQTHGRRSSDTARLETVNLFAALGEIANRRRLWHAD